MEPLGKRIRAARAAAKLSQADLAKRAGVAQAAISRIERGDTNDPGINVVAGIARALGISIDALVAGRLRTRPALRTLGERVGSLEDLLARLGDDDGD